MLILLAVDDAATMVHRPISRKPRGTSGERRRAKRYPLKLPVRYRMAQGTSWGQIENISSGGALVTLQHPAKPGDGVELQISWPVLLDEDVHLKLVARGAVVRAAAGMAAVRFGKCGFRTSTSAFVRQAFLLEFRDPGDLTS